MAIDFGQNRREFLKKFALLSAAGSALLLSSCDRGDDKPIPDDGFFSNLEPTPKYGVLPVIEPPPKEMGHVDSE